MPQKDIHKIALKACQYANQFVLKGSSQIENNNLSEKKAVCLDEAMIAVRERQSRFNFFNLENIYLRDFKATNFVTKKYSLGNCNELAYLALEYMINQHPNLSAEVFQIVNGDHVFLVINRLEKSEVTNPATWGKKAYICDPWAKRVFLAKDYRGQLKAFSKERTKDRESINIIKPFNPSEHILQLSGGGRFTSKELFNLNSPRCKSEMIIFFQTKLNAMASSLKGLAKELTCFKQNNSKLLSAWVNKRLSKIEITATKLLEKNKKIEFDMKVGEFNCKTYQTLKRELTNELKENFADYKQCFSTQSIFSIKSSSSFLFRKNEKTEFPNREIENLSNIFSKHADIFRKWIEDGRDSKIAMEEIEEKDHLELPYL